MLVIPIMTHGESKFWQLLQNIQWLSPNFNVIKRNIIKNPRKNENEAL